MHKIFITIDTEWDRKNDKGEMVSTHNLNNIPLFQEICTNFNIKPIYFCAYETLLNYEFTEFIKPYVKKRQVEIGAHLHPWSTPPFGISHREEQQFTSFPTEYSLNDFKQKLFFLTKKINEIFKTKPVSYRAGRFGLTMEHVPILAELGYRIDSSITPFIDWSKTKGYNGYGPNFSNYKQSDKFILRYNGYKITEFPILIVPDNRTNFKNIIKKIFHYRLGVRWLRIYPHITIEDLKNILETAIILDTKNFVFFMHSNEFHPDCNPYFTNQRSIDHLYATMENFFILLQSMNIESETFMEQI